MPDEIKVKVTITADTSGAEEAAAALENLQGKAGTTGDAMGNLGTAISTVGDQFSAGAEGTRGFSAAMNELAAPMRASAEAIPQWSEALDNAQGPLSGFVSSIEDLGPPLESTTKLLGQASPAMLQIGDRAQTTAEQLGPVSDGFVQIQESVSNAIPLLPQFADSVHFTGQSLSSAGSGLEDFAQNMTVFQGALEDPAPFSMIQDHLNTTGQTWEDFTSSIGSSNTAMLYDMATTGTATHQVLGGLNEDAQKTGATFTESAGATQAFTDQFNGLNDAAGKASQDYQASGNTIISSNAEIGKSFASAKSGLMGIESTGGSFGSFAGDVGGLMGDAFGGLMNGLNAVAMPLMAVQMIGMAVSAVGQGIYNAASIAEGSGAHGFDTFTGSIDALGQTAAKSGQAFSEAFGQQLVPNIQAANDIASKSISSSGGVGALLGGMTSFTLTAGSGIIGSLLAVTGMTSNPFLDFASQSLSNMFTYPTGGTNQSPGQIAHAQYVNQIGATVDTQTSNNQNSASQNLADASNPAYLQSQNEASASQRYLNTQQQQWDASHYISPTTEKLLSTEANDTVREQQNYANSPSYGQIISQDFSQGNYGSAIANIGAMFSGGQVVSNAPFVDTGGPKASVMPGIDFGSLFTGSGGAGGFMEAINKPLMSLGQSIGNTIGGLGQSFNTALGTGSDGNTIGAIGQDINNFLGVGGSDTGAGSTATAATSGGCFPAGTRVLCPHGTERTIEALRVGNDVIAHDGTGQIVATVLACISYPNKQTYELRFSDGKSLILTDSHPIATINGWKSLSPESSKLENPDLYVLPLHTGDRVYTSDGSLVTLHVILPHAIVTVYNITVDKTHTYYANGVLVHNKINALAPSTADASGGVTKNVPLTVTWTVQGALDSIQKQTSGWSLQGMLDSIKQQTSGWSLQGALEKASQQVSSWGLMGDLEKASQQVSSWGLDGILNQVSTQVSGWGLEGELMKASTQVSEWALTGELQKQWDAVSQWALTGTLNNTFQGDAKWAADGLEHEFNAVASWTASNLNPVFNVAASFVGLPGFASGVQNFAGGPALIAEGGSPEVVGYNGQYSLFSNAALVNLPSGSSVYPMQNLSDYPFAGLPAGGNAASSLSIGGGGGNGGGSGPQSVNLVVQLDSQSLIQAMGIPMASSMRVGLGLRGF